MAKTPKRDAAERVDTSSCTGTAGTYLLAWCYIPHLMLHNFLLVLCLCQVSLILKNVGEQSGLINYCVVVVCLRDKSFYFFGYSRH